jgi:transcriptional regulator GlxA family with amidase domain
MTMLEQFYKSMTPVWATPPAVPSHLSAIRLAIELIESCPELPLTTPVLAAWCNVSVRTLQYGFQRHMGISPMAYVREERLRRAHLDLRSADPCSTTVTEIAQRWGFTHQGRFSAAHKDRYGDTPAQVLRASA